MSFENAKAYSCFEESTVYDTVAEALEAWADGLDEETWREMIRVADEAPGDDADDDLGVVVYGFDSDDCGEWVGEQHYAASDIVEIFRAHAPSWFEVKP